MPRFSWTGGEAVARRARPRRLRGCRPAGALRPGRRRNDKPKNSLGLAVCKLLSRFHASIRKFIVEKNHISEFCQYSFFFEEDDRDSSMGAQSARSGKLVEWSTCD